MAQPLYMLAFAPTALMLWACAVRMSRTAELRGRLFGRSTTQLFAGGMMILGAMLAMAMCWMLDIPLEKSPSAAPRDVVKFGLLFFAAGLIVALGATAVIHLVPQRSRRSGPNRRANSVLFGFTYYVSKVTRIVLLAFLAFIFLVVLVEGPRSFRRGDWPMFLVFLVVALPLLTWGTIHYAGKARRMMSSYAKRRRLVRPNSTDDRPRVLYLRPFTEEHRLFAGSQTFEAFLGDEIAERVGPLVALGNPMDRIMPEGAERHYYDDDEWQRAVEALVSRAPCIVGVTSASANTAWELRRVRELGLDGRLYLLSPPHTQTVPAGRAASRVPHGRIGRAASLAGRSMLSLLAQDTDALARDLSFGQLPGALSPAGLTTWDAFVATLVSCGYTVDLPDPGPGAVVGFEAGGNAVLLARGATAATDYVRPIVSRSC